MSRRLVILSMILSLAAGLMAQRATAQPEVGGTAPAFSLPDLEGTTVNLSDFSGDLVVLHFGAGW